MSSESRRDIPTPTAPDANRPDDGTAAAREPGLPGPPSARARWRSALEVVVCSGYPTQLVLASILITFGVMPLDERGALRLDFVVLLSFADAVLLMGLVWGFLHLGGERPAAVLLGARRPMSEGLLGAALVPMLLLMAAVMGLVVQRYVPWLHNVGTNPFAALLDSVGSAILFGLVAIVAGGLREEVQRAFVLHRFEQHLGGAWLGLVLFNVAFGLGHLPQGYDAALLTGLFGLLWGLVYLWRRSVVAPVVSHALFNVLEVAVRAVVR